MKKKWHLSAAALLCLAFLCAALPVNAAETLPDLAYAAVVTPSEEEVNAAYADLVREKESEYGIGTLQGDGIYYMSGVGYLALVDLDGDSADELILATGEMFHATIEIYTYRYGTATQIYTGDAMMRGMDTPLVEIWEDDAGHKYLPVNKGDFFDGVLSFLFFNGWEMEEFTTASLVDPAGDTGLHRVSSAELSFGSSEEADNQNWIKTAKDRLHLVRGRLGLEEPAAGLMLEDEQAEESVLTGNKEVLVDDEVLTIVSCGKTMVRMNDGDYPVYLLTITNHTEHNLELSDAHLGVDFVYDCGTVDGATIIGIYFFKKENPAPDYYPIQDAMLSKTLPANSTEDYYMYIVCGGYGLRTTEDLVNVCANVHVSHGSMDTFWYRDYVLLLSQGEIAPALPTGTVWCESRYFRFAIPEAWTFEVVGYEDHYGYEIISLPPAVNDRAFSYITIVYDNFESAAEKAESIKEFYLADNASQGNYTVNTYNTVIGGKVFYTVEVVGKASNTRFCFYYLDLPDGNTLSIETDVELEHEDELREQYAAFLDSIQF